MRQILAAVKATLQLAALGLDRSSGLPEGLVASEGTKKKYSCDYLENTRRREVELYGRNKTVDSIIGSSFGFVTGLRQLKIWKHGDRNGEGGTVPIYNVQLLTDTTHGMVVNVDATTDAIDYRQLKPALERCTTSLGRIPKQIVADGDYTNHASVQAAADYGVDFYGSWQDSWKPVELDACGRSGEFLASAFPYDPERDCFTCPAGQLLTRRVRMNRGNGIITHVYHAGKTVYAKCPLRSQCAPASARLGWRRSVTRIEEPAATTAFKTKMATDEAQQIYAQRSQIAEFPHAWIKERCGVRQFRCRTRLKVSMEATWACLSYNLARWFSIRRRFNIELAPA